MFDSIQAMAEQAMSGNLDAGAVGQAVSDHLGTLDNNQLGDNLQAAASNLLANGQGGLAQQLTGLVGQLASNPSSVKDAIVSFVQNNPQALAQFAPEFAQGILSRL